MADLNSLETKINTLIVDVEVIKTKLTSIVDKQDYKTDNNTIDINHIDERVKDLELFRAKVMGMAIVASLVASAMFQFVLLIFGK